MCQALYYGLWIHSCKIMVQVFKEFIVHLPIAGKFVCGVSDLDFIKEGLRLCLVIPAV
jgi:hypothetical protein